MDIADLKSKQGKVELVGEVASLSAPREVRTATGPGRVANAVLKDKTGEIKLSLWNEQVDQVSSGDKVKIVNGYVSEFRGELQLSTGKFGTIEVLEKQKDVFGAVSETKAAAATKDNLEEADLTSGFVEDDNIDESLTDDEKEESDLVDPNLPSPDESITDDNLEEVSFSDPDDSYDDAVTADNIVEAEDFSSEKPKGPIVEEELEFDEEEVL